MIGSGTFRFHRFSEEKSRPYRYPYTTRSFYNGNTKKTLKTKTFQNQFPMNYTNNINTQSYQFGSKLSSNFKNTPLNSFQRGNNFTNNTNYFLNEKIDLEGTEFPSKKLTDLKFEKIISKGELSKIDKLLPQMVYNDLSSIENSHLKLVLKKFQNILKILFGEQQKLANNNKKVEYLFNNENSNLKKTIKKLEQDQFQSNVIMKTNNKQIEDLIKKINICKNILISSGHEKLIPKIKLSEIKMKNGFYSCQICPSAVFKTYEEMHAHFIKKHFSPFNNNKNIIYNNTGKKLFLENELNEFKNEVRDMIFKKFNEENKNEDTKIDNNLKQNFKSKNRFERSNKNLSSHNLNTYTNFGLNMNNDINLYLEQLENEQKNHYNKLNEDLKQFKNEVLYIIKNIPNILINRQNNDKINENQNVSNESMYNTLYLLLRNQSKNSTHISSEVNLKNYKNKIFDNEITKGNDYINNNDNINNDNPYKENNKLLNEDDKLLKENNNPQKENDKLFKENNTPQNENDKLFQENDKLFKENNNNLYNENDKSLKENDNPYKINDDLLKIKNNQYNVNENELKGNDNIIKENNNENNIKINNLKNYNDKELNQNNIEINKNIEKYIHKSNIIMEVSGGNSTMINIKDSANPNKSKIEDESSKLSKQQLTNSKMDKNLNDENENYIENPSIEKFVELFKNRELMLFDTNNNNNISEVCNKYQKIKMDKKIEEKKVDAMIKKVENNCLNNKNPDSINTDEYNNIISKIINENNKKSNENPNFMKYYNNIIKKLGIETYLKEFEEEKKNKQIENEMNNKISVKKSNNNNSNIFNNDDILSSNKSKSIRESKFGTTSRNITNRSKHLDNLLSKERNLDDFI